MSRYQVDPSECIPIYEFAPGSQGEAVPNVIYIRARLNVGQTNLVLSMAATRDASGNAVVDEQAAEYLTAQMVVSIVRWEGPDFDDLPCTPAAIRRLPGDEELIQRVRNEVALRNAPKVSPDQKKVTASGSNSSGSNASIAQRNGQSRSASGANISTLPNATTGHRSK